MGNWLKPQQRITLLYLSAAAFWILLSDAILYAINIDESHIPELSIIKGLGFVLFTGMILYLLLRREFSRRERLVAILADSEARFRKAVEEAPLPMMIFAEDGAVLSVSRTWIDITGYRRDQLTSLDSWTALAYGKRRQVIRAMIDQLFDRESRVDEGTVTITCAGGSQRIWDFSSTPLGRLGDGRRTVLSIAVDVTERNQAVTYALENERLRANFQKEQEQNAVVQRIVSMLSHDLKTRLTAISTSKDLLAGYYDRLTPESRQGKLDTIGRQVKLAVEMLDEAVATARGNLTGAVFKPAPVNLAALCRVSADEISVAYDAAGRISFDNVGSIGTVSVDETLISRILMNLLSNAVKYSPDGGEIRLELDRDAEHVILRVVDHGMGIASDDLPHIFDLFYRSDAANRIGGTGLGLSIVLECVERHWGQIHVESEPGQGSTFIVELPVS